jgi:hypothetical protein
MGADGLAGAGAGWAAAIETLAARQMEVAIVSKDTAVFMANIP